LITLTVLSLKLGGKNTEWCQFLLKRYRNDLVWNGLEITLPI